MRRSLYHFHQILVAQESTRNINFGRPPWVKQVRRQGGGQRASSLQITSHNGIPPPVLPKSSDYNKGILFGSFDGQTTVIWCSLPRGCDICDGHAALWRVVVVVNKLHGGFVARGANAGGLYELRTTMGTRVEPAPGGEWQHNPRVCSSYPLTVHWIQDNFIEKK